MEKRLVVSVISLIFLFGLSLPVSAQWEVDATGDQVLAGYDILQAAVETSADAGGTQIPKRLSATLSMNAGSSLPGMLILEFDVDDNASTGGNLGMASIFNTCEGGSKIKPSTPGFDVLIMLMLREQDSEGGTAFCDGCYGAGTGQCFIKDTPCDGSCGTADCYEAITPCQASDADPDCYLAETQCQPTLPLCTNCYEMVDLCTFTESCGAGRELGEWYADPAAGGIGGGMAAERGRIDMPLPREADSESKDVYSFPWKRIVEAVHAKSGGAFDIEAAKDATNIKWQISAWYDDDHAPPNDFFDEGAFPVCAEVVDIVPNAGKADTTTEDALTLCEGDADSDGDVDGTDASVFKADFGRGGYTNPCPTRP